MNRLVTVADGAEDDLSVEVVRQLLDKLRLDRQLLVHHTQVVLQLLVVRNDDSLSIRIVLRSSRTSEHLEDILWRELNPATLLGVVNLRALDDDDVGGKVDSPSERGGTDEDLEAAVAEEVFDERTVGAVHSGVVDSETEGKEVLERGVLHGRGFLG